MANYTPSNWLAAQTLLNQKFTSAEMREKILPTLQLGIKNKDILVKDAEMLRLREDRPVYGYAQTRQSRSTSGGTRTANHSGPRGDSMQMSFTWGTYLDKFSYSLKQYDNNIFNANQAFANQLENAILNIHADIETDSIAYLQTNRTQVVKTTTPVGGRVTWDGTNFVHTIGVGDASRFTQMMGAVMRANYYNDRTFDAIFNNVAYVDANFNQSQGAGNATNLAFQFTGMDINPSIELADANYADAGIAIAMRKGSYGIIPWIPKQNRMGHGEYGSFVGGYGSLVDPITNPGGIYTGGLVFAVHAYTQRADTASANGVQQDDLIEVEVSVDIAQCLTPMSTANETVVFEFVQS